MRIIKYSSDYDFVRDILVINSSISTNISSSSNSFTFVLIASLVTIVGLGAIHTSFGHAFVLDSTPAQGQSISSSPQEVIVSFSEPVDVRFSHVKVLDSDGKEVDNADAHYVQNDETKLAVSVPLLKDGTYTVSTNVLSQIDGHITDNAFIFAVGKALIPTNVPTSTTSSTLDLSQAIARFPTLVAQVMIVGTAFSTLWMWKTLSKTKLAKSIFTVRSKVYKNLAYYYTLASILLVTSNIAILIFQANAINATIIDVFGTRFGTVLIARSVISFVILGLSLYELTQFKKNKAHRLSRILNEGFLIIGIGLLITTSLIGHGASIKQMGPIIIDFVHNFVASIWIGGTFHLAFILIPRLRESSTSWYSKLELLSIWIPRHSVLIVPLLGAILITGPVLLYSLENDLGLVIDSLYGNLLLAKLTIAGLMVVAGGYSNIIIFKRIADRLNLVQITTKSNNSRHETEDSDNNYDNEYGTNSIISQFRRVLVIESIIGIALVLSVALLVNTGIPASEVQKQSQAFAQLNDKIEHFEKIRFLNNNTKVELAIIPFAVGNNNFTVSFLDMDNRPVDVQRAEIKYTQIEKSIGPITADLEKISEGKYSVNASFGIPGRWNMEVQGTPVKQNTPDIVASFDNLIVKPNFDQLNFNITEYPISNTTIQPLYPVYDKNRNYIWFGDTTIGSSRIFAFDVEKERYIEHKINGTNIITLMDIDSKNNLWYVDPLTKVIGMYDPDKDSSKLYSFPKSVTPSGIALDSNDNMWITSPATGELLVFDPNIENITTHLRIGENGSPFGITADDLSNTIWVTDQYGKLAKIDRSANNSVTIYSPNGNNSLSSPTALLIDPISGEIYISQHDGYKITIFDPLTKKFTDLPVINKAGLPFGMAFDKYRNVWVAEHVINKLAVIDTQSSKIKEVSVPNSAPFIQWIAADSSGNIWFAEQRGNSIGVIESTVGPAVQQQTQDSSDKSGVSTATSLIGLPLTYRNIVAPAILVGIVFTALMYARSMIRLKLNTARVS